MQNFKTEKKMNKNKTLAEISFQKKLNSVLNYYNQNESNKKRVEKKLYIIEKKNRIREMNLDLFLVERNVYDGSIKSNFQRLIEGKTNGKSNRFFDSTDLDWINQ